MNAKSIWINLLLAGSLYAAAGAQVSLFDGKTFQGVVSMDIRRGFEFPKDSSAKILTSGLLGDQYVGLEPGADEANLAPGATITQTQSALVLENLIGQVLFNKAAEAGSAGGATK